MAKKTPPAKVTPRFKNRTRRRTFFKQWRKHRVMTLEQAAELAGMTAGNLSAMERSEQGYTQAGLEALADVYKIPTGWLLDVNPTKTDAIMPIWEAAKPADRLKIVEIARTIVGKTGTDN